MVLQQRYINANKFLEIVQQPEYENRLVELVEGEIVEMSKPTGEHDIPEDNTKQLNSHLDAGGCNFF